MVSLLHFNKRPFLNKLTALILGTVLIIGCSSPEITSDSSDNGVADLDAEAVCAADIETIEFGIISNNHINFRHLHVGLFFNMRIAS